MYNAIVVRNDPAKEGHYVVVQGKHRLYATKVVLKEQFIAAQIVEGMDDKEAEFAMITENLWRHPLTKGQTTASVKKWLEYYQAKFGESTPAVETETQSGTDTVSVGAITPTVAAEEIEFDPTKRVNGFTSQLSAAIGVTKRQAERELRIAKAFDEDQLQVLDQEEISKESREHISKVKDDGDRSAIVNLIASGMDADKAIKAVMKDAAPAPVNKKAKEAAAAKKAARAEAAKELSDDEWYETYCSAKGKLLADATKYKSDALLYRKVVDKRAAHRSEVKAFVKATKEAKILGPFYSTLNRYISFTHPKDWALCGTCGGTGVNPNDETRRCPKCGGACYELAIETYL
jgi:hypothetical protein